MIARPNPAYKAGPAGRAPGHPDRARPKKLYPYLTKWSSSDHPPVKYDPYNELQTGAIISPRSQQGESVMIQRKNIKIVLIALLLAGVVAGFGYGMTATPKTGAVPAVATAAVST
jgi:hypothetical protein